MKWISFLIAITILLVTTQQTQAGLFGSGGLKNGECGESCQPVSCAPTIARPCHVNVYCYQRKCSNVKSGCGASACSAVSSCAPVSCCTPLKSGLHGATCCCSDGCGNSCGSQEDCHEIEELIRESKVGCYATDRRDAIHRLGDHYDCVCYPQIMDAFIVALNDSDERVRAKSADEIGDQIRRNRCICGEPVICALRHALADCDRGVRRQAEEALHWSGYEIVDGSTPRYATRLFGQSRPSVWSTVFRSTSAATVLPDSANSQTGASEPWTKPADLPKPLPDADESIPRLKLPDLSPADAREKTPSLSPSPSDDDRDPGVGATTELSS